MFEEHFKENRLLSLFIKEGQFKFYLTASTTMQNTTFEN